MKARVRTMETVLKGCAQREHWPSGNVTILFLEINVVTKLFYAGCDVNELPNLSDDDSVWDDCAYYIGQLCASLVLIASPERIIIGGGVLNRSSLYPKIRKCAKEILNGYIQNDHISDSVKLEQYIGPSYWYDSNDCFVVGVNY